MWLGQRRASSAQPMGTRSWTMPLPTVLQRDDSPLPEADTSLFDPSFFASTSFGFPQAQEFPFTQNYHEFISTLPPNACPPHDPNFSQTVSPLDNIDLSKMTYPNTQELDPLNWHPIAAPIHSDPSSIYSGSPTPSDEANLPVHAPQPHHGYMSHVEMSLGLGMDFSQATSCEVAPPLQDYATGLEGFFDPSYSMVVGHGNGNVTHDMTNLGFNLQDMVHESY